MAAPALTEVRRADRDLLLRRLGVTDAYYAAGYLEASAALACADPVLLHLAGPGGDVVFPLLLRADPVDVVTPYGYGGPVALGPEPPVDSFAAAYDAWCAGRGALTTFAVFHPLFANHELAEPLGLRREALAGTVAWRLEGDLAAGMHKHHRRLVRRAAAQGLTARAQPDPDSLDGFVELYEASMRAKGAADFYLFGPGYWTDLPAKVPLVRVDVRTGAGGLAGSVLGMGRPPALHYHLGATAAQARGTGASQLGLLALAEWGQANGFDVLHLGGGVGGRADSLLEFKLRFAPGGLRPAAIGKAVHDAEAYTRLTGRAAGDIGGFFPAYRAPR